MPAGRKEVFEIVELGEVIGIKFETIRKTKREIVTYVEEVFEIVELGEAIGIGFGTIRKMKRDSYICTANLNPCKLTINSQPRDPGGPSGGHTNCGGASRRAKHKVAR